MSTVTGAVVVEAVRKPFACADSVFQAGTLTSADSPFLACAAVG
ncbi:hypothetical protein ACFV0T_00830 [Streptomyces sp. NPDC059582]